MAGQPPVNWSAAAGPSVFLNWPPAAGPPVPKNCPAAAGGLLPVPMNWPGTSAVSGGTMPIRQQCCPKTLTVHVHSSCNSLQY